MVAAFILAVSVTGGHGGGSTAPPPMHSVAPVSTVQRVPMPEKPRLPVMTTTQAIASRELTQRYAATARFHQLTCPYPQRPYDIPNSPWQYMPPATPQGCPSLRLRLINHSPFDPDATGF